MRDFSAPVLAYASSPGISVLTEAIRGYYANLCINCDPDDIFITTGGSETLSIAMLCLLDPGDEIIILEPLYPNYRTFVTAAGSVIRPLTTTPESGYRYAATSGSRR